jgi:hypothetical protein
MIPDDDGVLGRTAPAPLRCRKLRVCARQHAAPPQRMLPLFSLSPPPPPPRSHPPTLWLFLSLWL